MQEEKDYSSEQETQIDEMGQSSSDTGESIADEDNGDSLGPKDGVDLSG